MDEDRKDEYVVEEVSNQPLVKWIVKNIKYSNITKAVPDKRGRRKELEKKFKGIFRSDTFIIQNNKRGDRLFLTPVINKFIDDKYNLIYSAYWFGYAIEEESRGYLLFPCKNDENEPKIITFSGNSGFFWKQVNIWPKKLLFKKHQLSYSAGYKYFFRLPEPFLDFRDYESISGREIKDRRMGFITYYDTLGNIILIRQKYCYGISEPYLSQFK